MFELNKIQNSNYFSIRYQGEEPWVMKPVPGENGVFRYGIYPNGLAWFFSSGIGLFIYDCRSRALFWKKELPKSRDLNGKIKNGYFYHEILGDKNSSKLYYLVSIEKVIDNMVSRTVSLFDIDITQREIVSRMDNLPHSRVLGCNCVLDENGCIIYSAEFPTEDIRVGLAKINLNSKKVSISLCENSSASNFLHSPSPNGAYWLRGDNSQIPYINTPQKKRSLFNFMRDREEQSEYFGVALEIWKGFPLERTAVVTPIWLSQYELPDEGNLDGSVFKDGKTIFKGAWKEMKPAKRAKIFKKISKYLQEHPNRNWDAI